MATTPIVPDINIRANSIANRLGSGFGIEPVTIIAIITQVLPLLISCFKRNDEPDPQQVKAAVAKMHERNPEQLRRRTARRIRGEADQPMTKAQSFALADATIAECLEADEGEVAAFAAGVV